jgi:DNA-binding NarL/FixJ family response regulator
VVVLSADVQRTTAEAVMAGGAQRFLSKPADRETLLKVIGELTLGPEAQ